MQTDTRTLFDLSGRTAIVTGALGILGRHFCGALADHGANVVAADLDDAACEAFAAELSGTARGTCMGAGCDVRDEASIERLLAIVTQKLGPIHILHNNAATKSEDLAAFFAPTETYALEEWRRVMAVNLDGLFAMAKAVGRRMIEQGTGGSIVQTSSIYGLLGADRRIYEGSSYLGHQINTPPVYATSKAGVLGLTRFLATEWARHRIRVNALVPGGVFSGQNETFVKNYSARVPLGRMGEPHELVGALVYLASDASSYVTGQALVVDGGLSAW